MGKPMRLLGLPLKSVDRARNVRVIGNNLSPVLPLARSQERSAFSSRLPSWMCQSVALQFKFSQRLNSLGQELTDFVEVLLVSAEAPKQSANEDGAMQKR